jgi:hypothetical protein
MSETIVSKTALLRQRAEESARTELLNAARVLAIKASNGSTPENAKTFADAAAALFNAGAYVSLSAAAIRDIDPPPDGGRLPAPIDPPPDGG